MKHMTVLLIAAVGLALYLVGCETQNPGTPMPNQPPTVELSFAPQNGDTVEHNKRLAWWGNDPDGQVVGYYLFVDGVRVSFTTVTDTTIAFASPVTEQVYQRTFAVVAVDNEGLTSDTASCVFYVINWAPVASFDPAGTISEGATVGRGFRVTVLSADTNAALTYYNLSLDDSLDGWMGWRRDSVYLFTAPEVISMGLVPEGVHGVPNTGLTAGPHTLYARVRDAGNAESPVVSLRFTVQEGFRPRMDSTVTATYGADLFYADGSVYFSTRIGVETRLAFSASAADYSGEIIAYRWRLADGAWSSWSADAEVSMTDAPPNDYSYSFIARDAAGAVSDTLVYFVRIVQQTLSDSVIVVDETVDGNGNPGSPNDAQADDFYSNVMQGWKTRQIDYATHRVGQTSYVSPHDVRNAGVILWHADDQGNLQLRDNTRLLGEFLDRGGRLIVSGWDVLGTWSGTADSIVFGSNHFGRRYLRLYEGRRNPARTTVGFDGRSEFTDCRIDPAKLPGSFQGRLPKCWYFQPSGECLITARMAVSDSLTNPLHGRPAAYLYYQSFRVAVFGVPLYFCVESEVRAVMESLMPWMLQGLE